MDAQVHFCMLLALSPQEVNKPHSLPQLSLPGARMHTVDKKQLCYFYFSRGRRKKKKCNYIVKRNTLKT